MFPLLLPINVWTFLKSSSSELVCKFSGSGYRNSTCPWFFQITYIGETLLQLFLLFLLLNHYQIGKILNLWQIISFFVFPILQPRINRWRSTLHNHMWVFQTAISNTTAHTLFYFKWAFIPVTVVRWIVNIRLSIVMSQGKYNCIRGISPKSKPKYTRTEMKEININNERAVQRGSAEVDLLTLNPSTWIITSKSKHSYIWIKALSSFALVTREWALPRSCRVMFRGS